MLAYLRILKVLRKSDLRMICDSYKANGAYRVDAFCFDSYGGYVFALNKCVTFFPDFKRGKLLLPTFIRFKALRFLEAVKIRILICPTTRHGFVWWKPYYSGKNLMPRFRKSTFLHLKNSVRNQVEANFCPHLTKPWQNLPGLFIINFFSS